MKDKNSEHVNSNTKKINMPSNDKGIKDKTWDRFEKILICMTFFCTLIGTIYAIKTSSVALKQSALELRPWISVDRISTGFDLEDQKMIIRFPIQNIGKLPAYVSGKVVGTCGDLISQSDSTVKLDPVILLPGETMFLVGSKIKGEMLKDIFSKTIPCQFTQAITIEYGLSKDDADAFIFFKKFAIDLTVFPNDIDKIQSQENMGLWKYLEGYTR